MPIHAVGLTTMLDRLTTDTRTPTLDVAFDARILDLPGGERGFGTYVRELVVHLTDAVTRVTLIVQPGREDHWGAVFPAVRPVGFPAGQARGLDRLIRDHGCDIFHAPLPGRAQLSIPSVVTLLDFIPKRIPGYFRRKNVVAGWWSRRMYERALDSCRDADAFVAISERTARDAVDLLGIDRARIVVTPLASPANLARTRVQPSPVGVTDYLLYVGSLDLPEKRRELDVLFEAYARLPAAERWRTPLVLAGTPGAESRRLERKAVALGIESTVVFPGYVAAAEMSALYSWARCVVFPSLHEGCGLPVLESLTCGTPVVTYANTSLVEVGGDLAVYSPPSHPAALAETIARVVGDDAWCARVAIEGPLFAAQSSWKATARGTREAYRLAAR